MTVLHSWFWSILSRPLFIIQRYFESGFIKILWQRILNARNYPMDYLVLHSISEQNWLIHYRDKKIHHYLENLSIDEIQQYASQFSDLPLYWTLQDCEMEFRNINLERVKLWDRSVLVQQLRHGEFAINDWIFYGFPNIKKNPRSSYLLAAIKADDKLDQYAQKISAISNPFAGIRYYPIEISAIYLEQNYKTKLNPWVIVMLPQVKTKDSLKLIIFHEKIAILQRNILYEGWADSLKATMRFLQRFGYEDDQPVSVLTTCKTSDIKGFEFINVEPFDEDNYNPIKASLPFIPPQLKQQYIAFIAPILTIRFVLPLTAVLLVLSSYYGLQGYFANHDYQIAKNRLEEYQKKLPQDYTQQLKSAELFNYFQATQQNNPSQILKFLGQFLKKKKVIASQINWSLQDKDSSLEIKFDTPIKKQLREKIHAHLEDYLKTIFAELEISWHNDNTSILMIRGQYRQ